MQEIVQELAGNHSNFQRTLEPSDNVVIPYTGKWLYCKSNTVLFLLLKLSDCKM